MSLAIALTLPPTTRPNSVAYNKHISFLLTCLSVKHGSAYLGSAQLDDSASNCGSDGLHSRLWVEFKSALYIFFEGFGLKRSYSGHALRQFSRAP